MKNNLFCHAVSVFILFVLASCGPSGEIRDKDTSLNLNVLKNGNIEMGNSRIRVEIAPMDGGRIVSLYNKKEAEELLEVVNPSNRSIGGAGYDMLNLVWPGLAEKPYQVLSYGLDKAKKILFVDMGHMVQGDQREKGGLYLKKRIEIDASSFVVKLSVTIENKTGQPMDFTYWHQSRPSMGSKAEGGKTTWLSLEGDVTEIPFQPGSGGHGVSMVPTDNYLGLTAKDSRSALVWLFPATNVQTFWTWHDVEVPTYDIVFNKVTLKPASNVNYTIQLGVLPSEIGGVSGGSPDSGLVFHAVPEFKGGRIEVKGHLYRLYPGMLEQVRLVLDILDSTGRVLQTLKDETIDRLPQETLHPLAVDTALSASVKGGYYRFRARVMDSRGDILLESARYVKLGEQYIPMTGKPLTLNFMWVLHQPIYPAEADTKKNIRQFTGIYKNIASLYEKHPQVKSDICITGALLYQLIAYYPEIAERYRKLVTNKTLFPIATGYGHALFPFISEDEIYYQVKMDREIKQFFFGFLPKGLHFPEMGYKDGILEPIVKNDIRWGYFSDIAIEKGYKNLAGFDMKKPSRLISGGGYSMDILIRDQAAVNILLKKTDRAVDEFIQYLVAVQEGNTNGDRVVVVANNGEFIGNAQFMDRLFSRLSKIPWVRFQNGEDIFRSNPANQPFLGEKVEGSWYYDFEKQETSFRLWFDTDVKQRIWEDLKHAEESVLKVNAQMKKIVDRAGLDVSYPRELFEKAWEHLIIAEQSDWIWAGSLDSYAISRGELQKSLSNTALVYDALMNNLRNKKNNIPSITSLSETVPETEAERLRTGVLSGKFNIWDIMTDPVVVTVNSAVNIRFKIYDSINGIDYSQVYVVYRKNDGLETFRVKAYLALNGTMKAYLGNPRPGDEVEYIIYAKDRKGNESISQKNRFIVTE